MLTIYQDILQLKVNIIFKNNKEFKITRKHNFHQCMTTGLLLDTNQV